MTKKIDFDKLPSDYDISTIIKEDTIMEDLCEKSFEYDCSELENDCEMERWFYRYLFKKGYAKSTVNNYVSWVKQVMINEKIKTWEKLSLEIDELCVKYDFEGEEKVFGSYGHRAVINALKRFKEFINQFSMQVKSYLSEEKG